MPLLGPVVSAWPGCNLRRTLRNVFCVIRAGKQGRSNKIAVVFPEISVDGYFDQTGLQRTTADTGAVTLIQPRLNDVGAFG